MSSLDTTREFGENDLPEDEKVEVEKNVPQIHPNEYMGPMTKTKSDYPGNRCY